MALKRSRRARMLPAILMNTRASQIADFYHQLALLVRSRLPLPESLRQAGSHLTEPAFQQAVTALSQAVAGGQKLSQALGAHARFFDPLHVRLIAAGEATGTLADTLFGVARFARFCQLMTARLREIVAYPLFTVNVALCIVLALSIGVVPVFHDMLAELMGGELTGYGARLPRVSRLVLGTGMAIRTYWPAALALYAGFLAFSIWIVSPGLSAHRALMALLGAMPGSWGIVGSLDSARLCGLLAVFLGEGMPLHDALASAAQLVDSPPLRRALEQAARKVEAGAHAATALAGEPTVSPLIVLTLRSTPEGELAEEFDRLGDLFDHRVTAAVRTVSTVWTVGAFMLMTAVVGVVIVGMFAPLTSLVSLMSL